MHYIAAFPALWQTSIFCILPPSCIDICMHIKSNNYKMFNRQIRFKKNVNYRFGFPNAAYIFFIFHIFCLFELLNFWIILLFDLTFSQLLHIWTFRFLNNSSIGFYYFTSFGFLNLWILVFSLLSFLLGPYLVSNVCCRGC